MKRISTHFIRIAVTALLLCVFTFNSAAGEVYTHNTVYQYEKEYSEAMFVKYLGTGTTVSVPSYMGGYPVTSVVRPAFENNKTVENVTLPYTVEDIGNHAFYKSTSLRTIDMSYCRSLTKIGANCFSGCKSLTSVKLPESVSAIGSNAFSDCTSLVSITLPYNVRSLGTSVFSGCSQLSKISLPLGLTTLSSFTFSSCYALKEVTLSPNMKTIYSNAFFNCYSIEKLQIPKSLTTISNDAFNCSEVDNIYYEGTKADWNKISIGSGNKALSNAKIHYLGEPHMHEYSQTTVAATCTTDGLTMYKCSCGHTYTKVTSKAGHKISEAVQTKATSAANGTVTKKCSSCSYSVKEAVPAVTSIALTNDKLTYKGKNLTPEVTVKDSTGKLLKLNTDYTLTLPKASKEAGKYTVTVNLKGKYSGSKKLAYSIIPAKPTNLSADSSTSSVTLKWSVVKGAKGYKIYIYNSKNKLQYTESTSKTSFKFTDLKKATIYKFKIKAYAKSGKETLWSSATSYFTTATRPSIPTIKGTVEKGKVNLSWTKQKGADGYVVYMATSQKGKYKSISHEEGEANLKLTKKGLKKGTNYYFKVRAYKTVGKAKIYGGYSKIIKIKAK